MLVRCFLLILYLLVAGSVSAQGSKERLLIGAASDLKFALDSIIATYKKNDPASSIQVSYGSSGKLFEQIVNGAPFDIFFSADKDYPEKLSERGRTISGVKTYGIGRIVLWSRKGDVQKEKLDLLLRTDIRKISIANPLHAPYGRRAEQALKFHNIYDQVKAKLVFGENVSQAAQFVTSGAADAGIIALSLALSPAMKNSGNYYLIPQDTYTQLEQAYVVLDNAKDKAAAIRFEAFLQTSAAKKILLYFGFLEQ